MEPEAADVRERDGQTAQRPRNLDAARQFPETRRREHGPGSESGRRYDL